MQAAELEFWTLKVSKVGEENEKFSELVIRKIKNKIHFVRRPKEETILKCMEDSSSLVLQEQWKPKGVSCGSQKIPATKHATHLWHIFFLLTGTPVSFPQVLCAVWLGLIIPEGRDTEQEESLVYLGWPQWNAVILNWCLVPQPHNISANFHISKTNHCFPSGNPTGITLSVRHRRVHFPIPSLFILDCTKHCAQLAL